MRLSELEEIWGLGYMRQGLQESASPRFSLA